MYGVCEAWRGVLPSSAPAAYCGQVNRRTQGGAVTAIHTHRSLLPSCSTRMRTSQPAVCDPSWGGGEASVAAWEFSPLLFCSPYFPFVSCSESSPDGLTDS